ncbi:MAG: tetratricopeptide repeat protein [Nitrospirae bacterium]|nr:tetratricopeptide repeat protein [Nitrospirota bacterium]
MFFSGKTIVRNHRVFLLFVGLAAILYGHALNGIFIHDDSLYVTQNSNIQDLGNIPRFFTEPRLLTADPNFTGHYRPLTLTTHALSYAISGQKPWAYKGLNLLLHVGSAFLIFLIVRAILPAHEFIALASGLVFLIHPFNTEAVNYATARSTVLSAFFYLLAFWGWVKYREAVPPHPDPLPLRRRGDWGWGWYTISLSAFLLAMLSKEVAITLPLVLWLYDRYFFTGGGARWKAYLSYLPFVAVPLGVYFGYRLIVAGSLFPHFQRDLWTQFCLGVVSWAEYLKLFVFPYGLSLTHEQEIYPSFWTFPVVLSYLLITGIIGLLVYWGCAGGRLLRTGSFFGAWFFITLLPTTIFPLNQVFQENRGYLAAAALSVGVGLCLGMVFRRRSVVGYGALAGLTLIYGGVAIDRNIDWRDPVAFFEREVRLSPGSPLAHGGLAAQYLKAEKSQEAIREGERAVEIDPFAFYAYFTLGDAYSRQGKLDRAIVAYEKGLKIERRATGVNWSVANLYIRQGRWDPAEKHLREMVRLQPDNSDPWYLLGEVYRARGEYARAREAYETTLRMDPIHQGAAWSLERLNKRKEE